MSQLYLTLPSDSSEAYHPNNTISNFVTRLHRPIDLGSGEWEVGLAEIIFPTLWRNIRSAEEGSIRFQEEGVQKVQNLSVASGFYSTPRALCQAVAARCKKYLSFRWLSNELRVFVYFNKAGSLTLSTTLADMLGIPHTFSGIRGNGLKGEVVWDTKRGLHTLYVYCSIVEHQLVGDASAPLLRVLPILGEHGQTLTHSFKNIHYLPAKGGQFQSIEVDIRDSMGELIPFDDGRVVVMLHLRKAIQSHLLA